MSHLDDVGGWERHIRKAFSAFNSRHANIRAEIQVGGQFPLCYGHFERASAGYGRYPKPLRSSHLSARGRLLGYDPASHGNFEERHQVGALFQVAFQSNWVVARIKRTGRRSDLGNADLSQVIAGVHSSLRGCLRCVNHSRIHVSSAQCSGLLAMPCFLNRPFCVRARSSLQTAHAVRDYSARIRTRSAKSLHFPERP